MITRRELLFGGAAALAAAAIGRSAWAAMPAASHSATAPAVAAAVAPSPLDAIIGESPAVVAFRDSLRALLDAAASQSRPPLVVFMGEAGIGKEQAARVIHSAGRGGGPFVSAHVCAIPFGLLEAELWGYTKGVFDRRTERAGLWEGAHRGTLFLDEIGMLHGDMWPRFRQTVETGATQRLGALRVDAIDVWTMVSSTQDPDVPIGAETLRERLAPLNPVFITVPPLRQRGDDALLLADYFLARHCREYNTPLKTLTPAAREALVRHPWPGNVRELSNVMERAIFLCEHAEIDAEHVPCWEPPSPPRPRRAARRQRNPDRAGRTRRARRKRPASVETGAG